MKKIFILSLTCVCFYGYSIGIYDSMFGNDNWENERKIRELQRKQECLENNQREMQDYLDCKNMEASLRSLNPKGLHISCEASRHSLQIQLSSTHF